MEGHVKVLSYDGVVLREDDLRLLSGPEWLNDNIITFYFSWLQSRAPPRQLLVEACVAATIAALPEAAAPVLEGLQLANRTLVLLPVNDNTEPEVALAGSHWSLLAAHRDAPGAPFAFTSFDSAGRGRANASHALRLARAFAAAAGQPAPAAVAAARGMPQQSNGCDCGCFVLCVAEALCEEWASSGRLPDAELLASRVTSASAAGMRDRVRRLVARLAAGDGA